MVDAEHESARVADPTTSGRRDWVTVLILSGFILVVAVGVVWWNNASPVSGHSHSHTVANSAVGEPGDPQLAARTVEVAMIEDDGGMKFVPAAIEVAQGDQVRFKITNKGVLDHEFILATLTDNLQHLEEMKKMPGMVHSDPNGITLSPNASGEILWRFTKAGSLDFSCLIPGHREAGMHGSIMVK